MTRLGILLLLIAVLPGVPSAAVGLDEAPAARSRISSEGGVLHGDTAAGTPRAPIGCARHTLAPVAQTVSTSGRRASLVSLVHGAAAERPVWKTIALGTRDSAGALRQALAAARCGVGDLAGEILDRPAFAVSERRTELDLAILSVAGLGIEEEAASLAEIYGRAARLGYALCPAEVGPQLRLQYRDQPVGEFLRIAMEPVSTPSEDFAAFVVGNGGAGLILIGTGASPELVVPSMVRFVFVRPRSADRR